MLNWRPDGIILDSDTIYSITHSLGVISLFLLCVGPPLKVIWGETYREDMVDIDSLTHWTIYTFPTSGIDPAISAGCVTALCIFISLFVVAYFLLHYCYVNEK